MRVILLVAVVCGLALAPRAVQAADIDDLKAAFQRYSDALNSRDANSVAEVSHPRMVVFSPSAAFARDFSDGGRAARRELMENTSTNWESFAQTPVNLEFRVIDNTGVVWGNQTTVMKPKDGPRQIRHNRWTYTFVKSGGKWLLLSAHGSAIPAGN
ncbi:MAG: nuclear transport factor 2 family protein [bacterium]|nr:nuclear transport factor 2 family protein [bacterium]